MSGPGEGFELGRQLARLADLTGAGMCWMPPGVDLGGHVNSLFGLRAWPDGYVDAIRVLDTTDVKAMRIDHEGGIVWQREGTLDDVVDGLLELPASDTPGAPRLVIGYAPTDLRDIS